MYLTFHLLRSLRQCHSQGRLSPEEIERMVQEAEDYSEEDRLIKERTDAKNSLETYLYNMRHVLDDEEGGVASKVSEADKEVSFYRRLASRTGDTIYLWCGISRHRTVPHITETLCQIIAYDVFQLQMMSTLEIFYSPQFPALSLLFKNITYVRLTRSLSFPSMKRWNGSTTPRMPTRTNSEPVGKRSSRSPTP